MTSPIKIPLRELNEQTIKDLQEKYPHAEVSLNVYEKNHQPNLTDEEFWGIIHLIDWNKDDDNDKLRPAILKLQSFSVRKIYDFADLLYNYLFQLDTKDFAKNIGIDAWKENGQYFSPDNFLYARLCVIANGKDFYNEVIAEPTKMPKDLAFEDLLYVASQAYQGKTGKTLDYSPQFPIETYGNKKGWNI